MSYNWLETTNKSQPLCLIIGWRQPTRGNHYVLWDYAIYCCWDPLWCWPIFVWDVNDVTDLSVRCHPIQLLMLAVTKRTLLVLIGSSESIRSIYAATRCCQQDFKSPLCWMWIWTPAAECQMPSESIRSDHCCSQEDAAPDFNWLIWIRPLLPNHCQMIYQVDTGTEGGPLGTRWWDNDGWFHDMQTCFPLRQLSACYLFNRWSSFSQDPFQQSRSTALQFEWTSEKRIWEQKRTKCIRGRICILITTPAAPVSCRIKTEFKTLHWILFTATAVQITFISVLGNWASSDENGFFVSKMKIFSAMWDHEKILGFVAF